MSETTPDPNSKPGRHGRKRPQTQQSARVIKLKQDGRTFDEIGAELGISRATAHRRFYAGLRHIVEPEVAAYRAEHVKRLAMERAIVCDILAARHVTISNGKVLPEYEDDGPTLAAIDRLLKIDEREARLLGLDSAAKVELGGGVTYQIVGVDPEQVK